MALGEPDGAILARLGGVCGDGSSATTAAAVVGPSATAQRDSSSGTSDLYDHVVEAAAQRVRAQLRLWRRDGLTTRPARLSLRYECG